MADDVTRPLPCAECGYDLRGTDSARCPECGADAGDVRRPVARAVWLTRGTRGVAPAYWATVLQVTFRGRRFAREALGPVSLADARRFWTRTAMILATPPMLAYLVAWAAFGGLGWLAVVDERFAEAALLSAPGFGVMTWVRPWMLDGLMPWSAGATLPGLMGLLVVPWAFGLCGLHTYAFHPRSLPVELQDRAVALSYYLCAPLTLAVAGLVGLLGATSVVAMTGISPPAGIWALAAASALLLLAGPLVMLGRVGQFLRRTTFASWPRTLIVVALLPVGWAGLTVLVLGLLPWCVGYFVILFDSLT